MKTRRPLILTARVEEKHLEPFDCLRRAHFPPDRNFLRAHLTMFHRLPGEYEARIANRLISAAQRTHAMTAEVGGVRHLGAGVAYVIVSPALHEIRAMLKLEFISWLGPQDMRKWQPHITVQNKSSKAKANDLFRTLSQGFQPHSINITGLDLWEYLGGPWQHLTYMAFDGTALERLETTMKR